jgi:3-isopropylmalate/(R)-2-methylmalate dehydratase large subunit
MGIEARLTLCNLATELGARFSLIAPDDITIEYLRGKKFAPPGPLFSRAAADWRAFFRDADIE